MKANASYNDFKGTVAADISDHIDGPGSNDLQTIGKYFKLDEKRFKIVGLSLYGPDGFLVSLYCVDLERSTPEKEHIVSMSIDTDNDTNILDVLFKRLHIVLHDKHDEKYVNMKYYEEVRFSEFHGSETD